MRHLLSLIAGVVAAPLAWAALAKGQSGAADTVAAWAKDNAFDTADLIVPGAYLAGAGILLGLIVSLRISPLGALVAALGYLGLNAGLFINPFAVRDAIPTKLLGQSIPLRTPLLNGTLLAVGALLLVAVFSAQRWRRWPTTETAATDSGAGDGSADGTDATGQPASTEDTFALSPSATTTPAPRQAADDTLATARSGSDKSGSATSS